ncbi:XVIPCD domain-containing protein [Luteibacter sp. CQ10]|uniref:XVIPCD domain-containing protein n=1 Tax=Luteibacter sp. CQ10 TaxID=2805821 RepID=UPI0034A20C38
MNRDIYNEARIHFFESGQRYEYGRPDMTLHSRTNGPTDPSRTEEDRDHDGKRGVDCSSFVWRGLHDAGYAVGDKPFDTHTLFNGHTVEPYARQHFDVISAEDARKPNGRLEAGDIIMFRSTKDGSQHVGIVRDYDAQGHIRFIGSQVSTGPAQVEIKPGGYWDGGKDGMQIVGALRAKPEFQTRQPLHDGQATKEPALAHPSAGAEPHHPSAKAPEAAAPQGHDGVLREGAHGASVKELQERLNALGVTDARGHRLEPDSQYGQHTREAVETYQRAHGLEPDGEVGPKTLASMRAQGKATPGLNSPDHAGNTIFNGATDATKRLDERHGRTPDEQSQRIAGAATVAAMKGGLDHIDHIVMNDDGSKGYAVQGDLNSPLKKVAEFDVNTALATPLEKSSEAALQVQNQAHAQAPLQQQQQADQHQQNPQQLAQPRTA